MLIVTVKGQLESRKKEIKKYKTKRRICILTSNMIWAANVWGESVGD